MTFMFCNTHLWVQVYKKSETEVLPAFSLGKHADDNNLVQHQDNEGFFHNDHN
jgi:hypothetical protein